MNAKLRKAVYERDGGRCQYCGHEVPPKGFHVDHIEATYRRDNPGGCGQGVPDDILDNLRLACARCNRWKATLTVEQFREEIAAQVGRLHRDSAGFRLALDFRQIAVYGAEVEFFFEAVEEATT